MPTSADEPQSDALGDLVTADRWLRVKALFDEALNLTDAERAPFLDEACGGDASLRSEVESLLAYHAEDTGILDEPPVPGTDAARDPLIGTLVGPYRLIDRIGQGGMGAVYRASRADRTFDKVVALKIIRHGMDTAEHVRRFHQERQALAGLDHPNIARLLDGGTTRDGLPYLAMEFVDGVPIDHYCDEKRVSIEDRLRLFRTICGAVHYAHQHLIVHRDIKPDNILVTPTGTPKLLDFGVAKILAPAIEGGPAEAVRAPTRLMTPDYASPEQVRGGQVTTASDIFSLGVLLYELVTGRRPFDLTASSLAEIERAICYDDPPAPSVAVELRSVADPTTPTGTRATSPDEAASKRGLPVKALRRRLAGDIDTIVAMAMRKEPQRRYSTVEQLSEDVVRHLRGLPVIARRDTVGYRAGKFIRRNKGRVVAAGALAVSLTLGVGATWWQALEARRERALAERRFTDVRRLATGFMFEVYDSLVNVPGTTPARAFMVKRAVEYLDNLSRESGHDVELLRELAAAYLRVGDVQGHPTSANVGDTRGAKASYEKTIAIAEGLLATDGTDRSARRSLAMAYRKLGDVLAWSGDVKAGASHAQASLREYEQLSRLPDAETEDHFQRAVAHIKLGDVSGNESFPNLNDLAGAMKEYDLALALLEPLAASMPTDERLQRYVGLTYERRGQIHESGSAYPAALVEYERSLEIRAALAARNKLHTDIQRDHAIAYEKIGNVLVAQGRLADGIEQYRRSQAMFEALYESDPSNAIAGRSLGISCEKLANALVTAKLNQEAVALLRRSRDLYQTIVSRDPANTQTQRDQARVIARLSQLSKT
ncbi:MAG: serine/threonine-protein kinase [Vicinamibacterales bacterium]